MDDRYNVLIDTLANKLGTTAEHLWGVLLRQAPISGFIDIVQCVVLVVFAALVVILAKNKTTIPAETNENPYPHAEWTEELAVIAWVAAMLISVIAVLCLKRSVPEIVAAFLNPEYWALKQLVR